MFGKGCQACILIIFLVLFVTISMAGPIIKVDPPFDKVRELAVTRGEITSNGCKALNIVISDREQYVFVSCEDQSAAIIMKKDDAVAAVGFGINNDGKPEYLVLDSYGNIHPVTKEQAEEIAFKIFRILVEKGLI